MRKLRYEGEAERVVESLEAAVHRTGYGAYYNPLTGAGRPRDDG
jgi:hypothetical protein